MHTLTVEQLNKVPWNSRFIDGADVPAEPPVDRIKELVSVPFMKRDRKYPLFYSWVEVVKSVGDYPRRVLDAACGRGIVSQILFLKGHEVHACDIAADCFCGDDRIDFQRVDLNGEFPYPGGYFDAVINCEGLECLEGSAHFLSESRRVLKDSGRLIMSFPNVHSLVGRYNFFRSGMLVSYDCALLDRRNVIYLPYVKELLSSLGFRISDMKGNVPQVTAKSFLFDRLFGVFLRGCDDPVVRFAHSIIMTAHADKAGG